MIQDPGPSYNLGFGVNARRDLPQLGETTEGRNPDSSFIAKSLHDHPFLKFVAASAATMVGMKYAGDLIRKGGTKLMLKGTDSASPDFIKDRFIALNSDLRSLSKTLDEWEGVYRAPDGTRMPMNYYLTPSERASVARGGDPVGVWGMREKVQQKLVSQARRLPYELPAAYAAQRLPGVGTDDMFGYGDERDKPNWYNPVDVAGDFVQQSIKNLGGFLIPVEAGGTVVKEGWKRILTHADGAASPTVKNLSVNLDASLKLLGHSSGELIHNMVRFSSKSTAAVGAGVTEAIRHNKGTVELLHEWRNSARTKGTKAWVSDQFKSGFLDVEVGDIAKPAAAARHFARGFRDTWSPKLKDGSWNKNSFEYKRRNLDAVRSGKTTFHMGYGDPIKVDPGLARRTTGQNSIIEQYAHAISGQIGLDGGLMPDLDNMRGSVFYKNQMTHHYKRHVIEALSEEKGINADAAKKVVELLRVNALPAADKTGLMPMASRFQFNDLDQTLGGYRTSLGDALEAAVPGHGKKIIDKLFDPTGPLQAADAKFINNKARIENRIQDTWNTNLREQLLPHIRGRLGSSAVPLEVLGDLTNPEVREYLIRNTADQINRLSRTQGVSNEAIPMLQKGRFKLQRSNPELIGDLKKYGFDLTGKAEDQLGTLTQMRRFLVDSKVVGKSGRQGYNAMGFRRMSVEDALHRGYFQDDIAPTIKRLAEELGGPSNPLGGFSFSKTPLGSVWETRSGRVIDFSPITNAASRAFDSFGENFQIPLLHIKPIETAGGEANRTMAQTPILQFAAGTTRQPFTGLAQDAETDLYMLAKVGRTKGTLHRTWGGYNTEKLAGTYKSSPIDQYSMLGRHVRLAIGDNGRIATEVEHVNIPDGKGGIRKVARTKPKERTDWRKAFSLDEHQPDSIRQKIKRVKGGRTWGGVLKGEASEDINNPAVFARKLYEASSGGERSDAARWLNELRRDDPAAVAKAFEELEGSLKTRGFSDNVINKILEMDGIEGSALHRAFTPGGIRVSKADTRADIFEIERNKRSELYAHPDEDIRKKRDWAQKTFIRDDVEAARSQSRYFEGKSSSQALRRRGIYRRIDEAKQKIAKLGLIEEGLEAGDFTAVSSDMFSRLEQLRLSGSITKTEYTEARAAIFSTQLAYNNITQFRGGLVRQEALNQAASTAASITDASMLSVLKDMSEYKLESGGMSWAKSAYKRRFGAADYDFEGIQYNPFSGNQDRVFTPTFSTTFNREGNKLSSVASVIGLNTWSNPEAFSGLSVPMSHGFQRLNGFLSSVGLSVDETDFRGPLDFYARGLVGKRVLPAVVAGTTFMTIDRTLGGLVNDRDDNGDRVYSPLLLGGVATLVKEAQVFSAALPGGQTMEEKRYELEEGEVAIRKGRFWPIGSDPWKGGKVQYYRPSWYRRFKSGYMYTDEAYGSPLERFAFGYDFSPLRPFAPYHYEKKHETSRPYPVTGDYFTGPWGPLTGVLNSTIGKIFKPSRKMHEEELDWKLSQYQQVGASGVAAPPSSTAYMPGQSVGYSVGAGMPLDARGTSYASDDYVAGGSAGMPTRESYFGQFGYGSSNNISSSVTALSLGRINSEITQSTQRAYYQTAPYPHTNSPYGLQNTEGGYEPRVFMGGEPMDPASWRFQASDIGYKTQEMLGIYGFAFGAARTALGLGSQDMSPKAPVLANSNKAYGSTRSFWDLNLGGLGDLPTPMEGDYANIEFSEFVRRFLTRERSDINYVNPISNDMGKMYPWLPGGENYINFKEGDPYCLSADSLVESNLQFIKAKDVKEKDALVGSWGQSTEVDATAIRSCGPTLKMTLSTLPAFPTTASPDHPFVKRMVKGRNRTARLKAYKKANRLFTEIPYGGKRIDMAARAGLTPAEATRALALLEEHGKVKIDRSKKSSGVITEYASEGFDEALLEQGLMFVPLEKLVVGDYVAYPRPQLGDQKFFDLTSIQNWSAVTDRFVYYTAPQEYAENAEFLRGERNTAGNESTLWKARQNINKGFGHKRYDRYIRLDKAMGFFVGLYCAEGSGADVGMISTSHHVSEEKIVEEAYVNIGLHPHFTVRGNSLEARIHHKALASFLDYMCGKLARNKSLNDEMLNFNEDFISGFIDGIFYGDGCEFVDNNRLIKSLKTSSWQLALQVRKLLLTLNIVSSVSFNPASENPKKYESVNNIIKSGDSWNVKIHGDGSEYHNKTWFSDDSFFYFRVNDISLDEDQITYGFSTDSRTFCVPGAATHNTAVPTGEARLPGKGYERFNQLHSDETGRYGLIDQFKILGDIAPNSTQYRQLDRMIDGVVETREEQGLVDTVRYQVAEKAKKVDFDPYEYHNVDLGTTTGRVTRQLSPGVFEVEGFDNPVQLAGVTPSRSKETRQLLDSIVGQEVSLTYDKNRPAIENIKGIHQDVMMKVDGLNVNRALVDMGGYEKDSGEGLLHADNPTIDRASKALWERVTHKDTPINTKFMQERTAVEDWERRNVYGATFPQWQNPVQDFIKPMIYKATNRGPIISTIALGAVGAMFGAGHSRVAGSLIGAAIGFGAGLMQNAAEHSTGERFVPKHRKKELAVEEMTDILTYVKNMKLMKEAAATGDTASAERYQSAAKRTMYGVDLKGDVSDMLAALPDRKRPYFMEMLKAPKQDRNRILSTAGRLERRMYQAAWGMDVEKRPELEEYFEQHELPTADWAGFSPDVDMEYVKIKMAQNEGLDVSQMGYYPQQVAAANAINIAYPSLSTAGPKRATQQMLQAYLSKNDINGMVRAIPNNSGREQLVISAGVH